MRVAIATGGEINNNNNNNNNNGIQQWQPNARGHAGHLYDDLFQDLQLIAQAENNNNNNIVAANNGPFDEDAVEERVQAKMVLYKQEPWLPLQDAQGRWNNPLDWWKDKRHQYPLLVEVAMKYLAISTTLAPSERVFSTAGLTIASERSRLCPANAAELVFLHDVRGRQSIIHNSRPRVATE